MPTKLPRTRTSLTPPERAREVQRRLRRAIPEPRVELDWESPWQLLVATILAAQNTDATVNLVTPVLFSRHPSPARLAAAPPAEIEQIIRPTGFFRSKTKAIQAASRMLDQDFGGEVPRTVAELTRLPGVARKTANVVLGGAYGIASGFVVDTHVSRVAPRLALTDPAKPGPLEQALCALFPKRAWVAMSHRLILHGRYMCKSRTPRCEACCLNELCPASQAPPHRRWTQRADGFAAELQADPRGRTLP